MMHVALASASCPQSDAPPRLGLLWAGAGSSASFLLWPDDTPLYDKHALLSAQFCLEGRLGGAHLSAAGSIPVGGLAWTSVLIAPGSAPKGGVQGLHRTSGLH